MQHRHSAVSVTLPAFTVERHAPGLLLSAGACYQLISPARAALSRKPAGGRCCCRSTGQTDVRSRRRTGTQELHEPCSAYYAGSFDEKCQQN